MQPKLWWGWLVGLIGLMLVVSLGGEALAEKKVKAVSPKEMGRMITAIEVAGNRTVSTEQILGVVFSRVGDEISSEKVKNDMKAIYAAGYFADVNVSFKPFRDGTKIIFRVAENPVLKDIVFQGSTVFSTAEIVGQLKNKVGDILDYRLLQDDIRMIDRVYRRHGYVLAKVVEVVTSPEAARLAIKVSEGIVERIAVTGNDNTKDYVILREMKTQIGFPLNENLLTRDLRRVFNLGFFSDITPNFEPGSSTDRVILVIKVKENRTGTVNFGGGYGDREGWFGFSDLSVDNLFGTGQGVLLRGQFGSKLQTYQFRYFHPWVFPEYFGDHTSFTFRRWYTVGRDIYVTTVDEVRNGWDTSVGKPFGEHFNVAYSLGSEGVSPTGTASFESYIANTIGLSLAYDTRDFWMNPHSGSQHTFSVRQGWKFAAANTTFTKYGLVLGQFFPVADQQTLAMRLDLGLALGDIPISEYYWAGGPTTVRGYQPFEPRLGKRKVIYNLEYRYTFNDILQGVIFYDIGDAFDTGIPDKDRLISGKGIGLRINTPLGPIRLDYGVAAYKDWGEGVTHFSIGQAF